MELGAVATRKLQEIRRSYGLQKESFKLPEFRRTDRAHADEAVMPGSEVQKLFLSGFLLVRNDRIVFAYIRDHRRRRRKGMYKVHMAACKALKEMKEKKLLQRYVVTESVDDEREIDIGDDDVVKVRLDPCQFCLEKTHYRGFSRDKMTYRERKKIVDEFRAKDVLPHLNTIMEIFLTARKRR